MLKSVTVDTIRSGQYRRYGPNEQEARLTFTYNPTAQAVKDVAQTLVHPFQEVAASWFKHHLVYLVNEEPWNGEISVWRIRLEREYLD